MEDVAVAEIRSNVGKAFFLNLFFVGIIVVLIIGISIYLNTVVGLGIFLDGLKVIGVTISGKALLGYIVALTLLATVLILVLNYVNLGKMRVILYRNKLEYSKSLFVMQLSENEISFENIAKVSIEKKPFFNTSKIILGLNGLKQDKLEIDFIDDAEEVAAKIQELIKDYRARYYAQYTQNYRMQNIMETL